MARIDRSNKSDLSNRTIENDTVSRRARHVRAVVIGLLVLMAGRSISSMYQESVTTDEMMYIAAGYYHLKTGDFRMNATNTPLMKLAAGAPLLLLNPSMPVRDSNLDDWTLVEQWQYARAFLYENRVDADRMLFAARLPIVAIMLILGWFVFRWSSELFGESAGLLSLFVFSFSPNILAHGHLATHDLGLAAFMFIACYYYWRYLESPSLRPLILCGLFTGLSLLAKTPAIFLAPAFAGYALVGFIKKSDIGIFDRLPWVNRLAATNVRARLAVSHVWSAVLIGLIALVTLNVGYGFQGTFSSIAAQRQAPGQAHSGVRQIIENAPLPLPAPFVRVVGFQNQLVGEGGGVYFAGKLHEGGLWYLTLVSCLLKTPLALTILTLITLFGLVKGLDELRGVWLLLIFIGVLLFAFSFLVKVNANVRYVLSIYPFAHVLVGGFVRQAVVRPRWKNVVLVTGVLWYAVSSVGSHPHYLAYFNELVGGSSNGYRYLADSNVDWGQDLKGLSAYMQREGIDEINLGYFGSADANYYGIKYNYLPSVGLAPKEPGQTWWFEQQGSAPRIEPTSGVYAISANLIASQAWMTPLFHDAYSWFREHDPVDQIGHSILIYKIE